MKGSTKILLTTLACVICIGMYYLIINWDTVIHHDKFIAFTSVIGGAYMLCHSIAWLIEVREYGWKESVKCPEVKVTYGPLSLISLLMILADKYLSD